MLLRRISVVGGTGLASRAEYVEAARRAGSLLAESGITLMHGEVPQSPGSPLAAAVQAAGGRALPSPPAEIAGLADGFLALAGGPGSLGELFLIALDERGEKPCGLLNTADYYTDLLKTTEDPVVERFVRESQRGRLIVAREPAELLRTMADFRAPETRRQFS